MASRTVDMPLFPTKWMSENGIWHEIHGMNEFLIRNAMRRLLIDAAQRMAVEVKVGFESLTPAHGRNRMLIEERRLRAVAQGSIHDFALKTPIYAALNTEAKRRRFDPLCQGGREDDVVDAKPPAPVRRRRKAAEEPSSSLPC